MTQTPNQQRFLAILGSLGDPPDAAADCPEAAVAICVGADASGAAHLLLIKRAEHPLDPWSGHIGLPGGRRDPGDPHVLHTASRETEEEVGIILSPDQVVGALPPVSARRRGVNVDLLVHPIVFALDHRAPVTPSYEVAASRWVALSTLTDPRHAATKEIETPDGARQLPGVHLHGDDDTPPWLLWGLTYRMLSNLVAHAGLEMAAGRP